MTTSVQAKLNQFIRAGEKRDGKLPDSKVLASWAQVEQSVAEEALRAYSTKVTEVKVAKVQDVTRPALRWLSAVISVLCMVWSWGNIVTYYEGTAWGWLIATVITSVLFVFPQTAKIAKGSTKVIQYALFAVSIVFAMLTTVNANYSWRSATVQSSLVASSAKVGIDDTNKQIASLQDSIDADSKEKIALQDRLPSLEIGTYEYNRVTKRIDALTVHIDKARESVSSLVQTKADQTQQSVSARTDLFQWIEGVLGIKDLEFWLGLIPALVADVAGPLALRVAIFI